MEAVNSVELMSYVNLTPSGSLIALSCPECKNLFHRMKNVIQSKFGKSKNQQFLYCSHACSAKASITLCKVNCLQCNKLFDKLPNAIRKFPNNFCTNSCAATYNNVHKTTGVRRSKLESWIESRLTKCYPNLEIQFNCKKAITSELDIYLPTLQLAFELNGIFHYEPIFGIEKLSSIQRNDTKKIKACLERHIELIIIDNSEMTYFRE
jgi:hypothetical protein